MGVYQSKLASETLVIFMPKNQKRRENNKMAVIIKLNGDYIGATTMTAKEIKKAQNEGFTIVLRKEGR